VADDNTTARGGGDGKGPTDIRPISITDEMKRSYLDYAMSVIVSRAPPTSATASSPCIAGSCSG